MSEIRTIRLIVQRGDGWLEGLPQCVGAWVCTTENAAQEALGKCYQLLTDAQLSKNSPYGRIEKRYKVWWSIRCERGRGWWIVRDGSIRAVKGRLSPALWTDLTRKKTA